MKWARWLFRQLFGGPWFRGQLFGAELFAGQPVGGQPVGGQPISQSIAGQSIAGQSIAGQSIAGAAAAEKSWRFVSYVLVGLLIGGELFLSVLCFSAARDDPSISPQDLAVWLTMLILVAGLGIAGFTSKLLGALFKNPLLEILLVAPLSERQIFWRVWGQVLTSGTISLGLCGPAWGWLLGHREPLWLYPATALIIVLGTLACAALAAVLAQLGQAFALIALGVGISTTPLLFLLREPRASDFFDWPGFFGWHPIAALIPILLVTVVVLLAVADLLRRLTFTHRRLAGPRPGSQQKRRPTKEAVRPSPALARRLFRRLDRLTHARWRMLQGDEHPESFVRHLPLLLVSYGVLTLVGLVIRSTVGMVELPGINTDSGTLPVLPFLIPMTLGIFTFVRPSSPPWLFFGSKNHLLRRLSERQRQPGRSEPLQQVFPVPIRDALMTFFLSLAGLYTTLLLISTPFVVVVVDPRWLGRIATLALVAWLGGVMLIGFMLHGLVPRMDPRRDPTSIRHVVTMILTLVFGVGLIIEWVLHSDRYIHFTAFTRRIVSPLLSGYSLAGAVLVLVALEIWAVRSLLRRHRTRDFDVMY